MKNNIKNNKSQAAVEFLLTYGWAILVVLVVVGALTYFGLFNTQKYVNSYCNFGDQLSCEDYALYADGHALIKLRNNFGVPIDIDTMILNSAYGTTTCDAASSDIPLPNIPAGSTIDLICNLTGQGSKLNINTNVQFKAIIGFARSGVPVYLHNQTGDLLVTVQNTPNSLCIDTDGGIKPNTYGVAFGYGSGGPFTIYRDICLFGSPDKVREALCNSGVPKYDPVSLTCTLPSYCDPIVPPNYGYCT